MKKLRKTQISWFNHETDEITLFLHEQGGPDAVKVAVTRMQEVINNNAFKECADRYYKSLDHVS